MAMSKIKAEDEALGQQLLHEMSQQKPDMDDIGWLIGQGASMTVTDQNGYTPLAHMLGWGNAGYIKGMLDHGADVNYRFPGNGRSLLQGAVGRSSKEIVTMMLEAGGDVFQADNAGENALSDARRRGDAEIFALVEARAKAQQPDYEARAALLKAAEGGMQVDQPFRPLKPLKLAPKF
ncbi:MAG: ankyrin repeat domain-containing protein [Alphaproteobacteria bacterium]